MKKYLILTLCIFIYSCSQPPKKPEKKEYFVTHILADGTKMFNYTLEQSRGGGRNGNRGGNKGGGRGGNKGGGFGGGGGGNRRGQGGPNGQSNQDFKQKMQTRAYNNLDDLLVESNYCREGYQELNASFERGRAEIKGQCNEKANDRDRLTFKNQ